MDVDNGLGQSLILLRERFGCLEADLGWLTGEHRIFPSREPVRLENWRVASRLVPCLAGSELFTMVLARNSGGRRLRISVQTTGRR